MRLTLSLCLLAYLAPRLAAADQRAPEPGQLPAQTRAQDAAQEMIRVYEEFCLVHFPDPNAVAAGAAAHHMTGATPEQAATILLGRPGSAWTLVTPKGTYGVAVETGARQGCAVSGDVADDAGIRASFDLLVSMFAGGHEFGTLAKPPLQSGLVNKQAARLQLIGATPDGRPKQAFVNMATGDGPVMHVRMTRELAPGT
jgi:hypothetical protein